MKSTTDELDQLPPAMPLHTLISMLFAVTLGALAAAIVLPNWLPGLSQSLLGHEPKAYWYLSRASALVAYALLWLSMVLGLIITNKLARVWPGGPLAFDLHQFTSLIGLAFALFHALILLGDKYINYDLAQVLVPFNSTGYKPAWVGLGQIGFYLLAIVGLSFYIRKRLGNRLWRLIHYLSFLMFVLALLHGILAGTDSTVLALQVFYWASGASLLFLFVYRIFATRFISRKQTRTT
ncbi:MAG TPA: ferric reductase-like transmembrane domain-containing protein [Anaerolineae bacterium]|nr:ferric reductase-like transmembrane domain-containing protein [Anaerolineae bacterium]